MIALQFWRNLACVVVTQRMICNMTHLGHLSGQVICHDQTICQLLKLTYLDQKVYVSMREI